MWTPEEIETRIFHLEESNKAMHKYMAENTKHIQSLCEAIKLMNKTQNELTNTISNVIYRLDEIESLVNI